MWEVLGFLRVLRGVVADEELYRPWQELRTKSMVSASGLRLVVDQLADGGVAGEGDDVIAPATVYAPFFLFQPQR